MGDKAKLATLDKHNLLGFHASGKCECDPESNAAPCMSCAAEELLRDIAELEKERNEIKAQAQVVIAGFENRIRVRDELIDRQQQNLDECVVAVGSKGIKWPDLPAEITAIKVARDLLRQDAPAQRRHDTDERGKCRRCGAYTDGPGGQGPCQG